MTSLRFARLASRGVLRVSGGDAREFLQGLISNDVDKATAEHAVYAAFLTPQGKYLFDFFVAEIGGALHLDCEAARLDEFLKRLKIYKLRADVELADVSDEMGVYAAFGDGAAAALDLAGEAGLAGTFADGAAFVDPRLADAGARVLAPGDEAEAALAAAGFAAASEDDYDAHRLALGLPDGSRDMEVDKAILLESGFEELNGVDWDKGCYLGQELTARTRYRGLVKKRLLPVTVEGPLPAPGTEVTLAGRNAGEVRSGRGGRAIALLRLDAVASGEALEAGEARLTPAPPAWFRADPSAHGAE